MIEHAKLQTKWVHTNGAKFHDKPKFFPYDKGCEIPYNVLMATMTHGLDFFLKHKLYIYQNVENAK